MKGSQLKIGVSGVRGIVGESFTPALAADFAAAFGEYVGGGRVLVSRDTRQSGEMIEYAVVAGLIAVGCQPVLTGICPTPTLQIAVADSKASGGVAISASHNPVEWNALKFIGPQGTFLSEAESSELLDIYNQPDRAWVPEQDYHGIRKMEQAFAKHQERIFSLIDAEAIRSARFKVAIDPVNGVGSIFTRPFLEALGCEVVSIFDKPDGLFMRPPEPLPPHLAALGESVRASGACLGFAQDPDGDRLALVDKRGMPIGEQYTLVLAAEHVLSKTPGDVVVNVQTTKAVEDLAHAHGCEVNYSMVGEINVVEAMRSHEAVIGGEGSSGGVIWPALHPCRDSFSAMALILEMLALRATSLDEILASLPRYVSRSSKFPCPAEAARDILQGFRALHPEEDVLLLDGIRLNIGKSWVLLRASNTEPVLRLTVEAPSEEEAIRLSAKFSAELKALHGA